MSDDVSPAGAAWEPWQPLVLVIGRFERQWHPRHNAKVRVNHLIEFHGDKFIVPESLDVEDGWPIPDGIGWWVWEGRARMSVKGEMEYDGKYRPFDVMETSRLKTGHQPIYIEK